MSEQERAEVQNSDREQFSKFLKQTAEEVRGWPAWKQMILGIAEARLEAPCSKSPIDAGNNRPGQK